MKEMMKNQQRPENGTKPGKGAGSSRLLKEGAFSIITSLILLLTLLFINLTAGKIKSKYMELDISDTGLYELSAQTQEIVDSIHRDVDVYWIVQSGRENSEIEVLLNRYRDLNSRIHVEKIDPVVNPNFTDNYTSEIILDNSLIVAAGTRSRYISYNDIFTNSYSYYTGGETTTYFDGENKLSSALDYVNDGAVPKICRVTGHGEAVLSNAFEDAVKRQNYVLENLNTLSLDAIPEDVDCLLLVGPTADLSAAEGEAFLKFLERGGRILAFTDYEHTELPVLMGLLEHYHVEVCDGLVLEADPNMCYGNYPMQLLPGIIAHDITSPITRAGYMVLVPMAHGLMVPETKTENQTVSTLLRTSGRAYAKEGRITSISRTEEDIAGPFALGIAAEERIGEEKNRVVWFSTSQIINKDYDSIVNGVNTDMVLNALGWLTENESSITIHSKQISSNRLTVPGGAVTRIAIVLVGVIPILYLLAGIFITVRRRKR